MKGWIVKAFLAALAVHAAVLLFGGLVLFRSDKKAVVRENVELVAEQAQEKKVDKKEPEQKKAQEAPIEESDEPMPDVKDLAQLEAPIAAPALAPLSLADLEGVLSADGGGGSFATGAEDCRRAGGSAAPGRPAGSPTSWATSPRWRISTSGRVRSSRRRRTTRSSCASAISRGASKSSSSWTGRQGRRPEGREVDEPVLRPSRDRSGAAVEVRARHPQRREGRVQDARPDHVQRELIAMLTSPLLAAVLLLATDAPLDDLWKDPTFQKEFLGSYGFQAELEPKVTALERQELEKILTLMAADTERGDGRAREGGDPRFQRRVRLHAGQPPLPAGRARRRGRPRIGRRSRSSRASAAPGRTSG